jgi:hypothetical protein
VQELERAGPVRAQHHVVIAETVVELAHAGHTAVISNCRWPCRRQWQLGLA